MTPTEHAVEGRALLERIWAEATKVDLKSRVAGHWDDVIDPIFHGKEGGYKKAIIIQLVGRLADPTLDAQCMQKGISEPGMWDAREFAKRAFNPWNQSIGGPLGSAADPYVGNQFRNPRFDDSIREQRRDKKTFDAALEILEQANAATGEELEALLLEVMIGLRRWMQDRSFDYPLPERASLERTLQTVEGYLAEASGGARLQALAHALVTAAGNAGFHLDQLTTHHINASDTATKASGDTSFESLGRKFAVEVKDRPLDGLELEASVRKARVNEVTELIFLVYSKRARKLFRTEEDENAIALRMIKEFSTGLNIYVEDFLAFARTILVILGEVGRKAFLKTVGETLELQKADTAHRWEWSKAVSAL